MPAFDAADCLARLRNRVARPTTDADLTDQLGYELIGNAELEVFDEIATHCPQAMYGAPVAMTTSDSKLFTFGGGVELVGKIEVFDSLSGEPLTEGDYGDTDADYTREGTTGLRITANRTKSGTLYARGATKPVLVATGLAPTLTIKPTEARKAVVEYAAAAYCERPGSLGDPATFRNAASKILWGDPDVLGSVGVIPREKLKFLSPAETGYWWRSRDLGRVGF